MRSDVYGNKQCKRKRNKVNVSKREVNVINNAWFIVLSTIFEHSRIVFRTWKNVRALTASCALRAGNNSVLFKNSTEHAEPLFIALIVCWLWKSYNIDLLLITYRPYYCP